MARKVVFSSGASGVGKTSVCALSGVGLSMLGKKVALLDLNVGYNCLSQQLGVKAEFDLLDVLYARCRLKQALYPVPNYSQLYSLPAPRQVAGKVDIIVLHRLLNFLDENFDFLLIDCPAWIELPFYTRIFGHGEVVLVSSTDKNSILSTNNLAGCVCGCECAYMRLFINNLSPKEKKNCVDTEIAKWLGLELFDSLLAWHNPLDLSNIQSDLCAESLKFAKKLL